VTAFVRDRCVIDAAIAIPCESLFQPWRLWCDANGRKEHGTVQTFGRDLSAAFPTVKVVKPRERGKRVRQYQGIGLTTDAAE
jgi:putative DNA primase/helicase